MSNIKIKVVSLVALSVLSIGLVACKDDTDSNAPAPTPTPVPLHVKNTISGIKSLAECKTDVFCLSCVGDSGSYEPNTKKCTK